MIDRFAALERAVDKYELTANERFASVNEFRGVVNDQATRLISRAEVEVAMRLLGERIDAARSERELLLQGLQARLASLEAFMNNILGRMAVASILILLISGTIAAGIAKILK